MSRTSRLFELIQLLRARRHAVTAASLAQELCVSKRTVHRDLDMLRALGAPIDGEAGVGYVLQSGFLLPPLMMTVDELEALSLGALWVRQHGDAALASAAGSALGKISAVVPQPLTSVLELPALLTAATKPRSRAAVDVAALRSAIRDRRKLSMSYRDERNADTQRIVWPVALVYIDEVLLLASWCELRRTFRHFRADRIHELRVLTERYPVSRAKLTGDWKIHDQNKNVRRH